MQVFCYFRTGIGGMRFKNVGYVFGEQVGFFYRASCPSALRTANWWDYLQGTREFPGSLP